MKSLFYTILLFLAGNIYSQIDKELTNKQYLKLQEKARAEINGNLDSALVYSDKIQKSSNIQHKIFAKSIKSYIYELKNDSLKSNECYKDAEKYLSQTSNSNEKKKLYSYLYLYKGLTLWKRNKLYDALIEYNKGKKISESINDVEQIVKFNNNISNIYKDIENYTLAIETTKETEKISKQIEYKLDNHKLLRSKSIMNLHLGVYYEGLFSQKPNRLDYLDSSKAYYVKAIFYSKNQLKNKITAQVNLANIHVKQNKLELAEKEYLAALVTANEENEEEIITNIYCNLGVFYFYKKDLKKAVFYFSKVDSIYVETSIGLTEYMKSSYFLTKIYNLQGDSKEASVYSKKYLSFFEEKESEIFKETLNINYEIFSKKNKIEIEKINRISVFQEILKKFFWAFILVTIVLLFYLFKKQKKEKEIANEKIRTLISDFKQKPKTVKTSSINIDDEKEKEIIKKLEKLEEKLYFLREDFNLQTVAKKTNTNTTYLSYIVNKNFEKTFSEYSNELKINYVIYELINNKTYQKYSTQAMAESVGFKNAISFSKSFSKRTGVTPIQFAKNLLKKEN